MPRESPLSWLVLARERARTNRAEGRSLPSVLSLLDRLVYAEVGGSLIAGVVCFTVLLAVNYLLTLAHVFVNQGLPVDAALVLTLWKIPYLAAFSVPMGVLLASVVGLGRLVRHHEIAALRTSGISIFRMAVPLVLIGAAAAGGTLIFSEGIVSQSERAYHSFMARILARPPQLQPVANQFVRLATPDGTVFYAARRYDAASHVLEDAMVVVLSGGRVQELIQARDARLGVHWTFDRGYVYRVHAGSIIAAGFGTLTLRPPHWLSIAEPVSDPSQLALRQIVARIAEARQRGRDARPYWAELHRKLSAAASSIVFALAALPLSLRSHQSGFSTGFGLSLFVIAAYYSVAIPSQLASDAGVLAPSLAAWLPDALLGFAGTALLIRAARCTSSR